MTKVVYWRDAFAQHGNLFTSLRRLTDQELEKKGEDPAYWALLDAVKESSPDAPKMSTWFCPTANDDVVDLILGWDHGVLLEREQDGFKVRAVFRRPGGDHVVAKNKEESWDDIETWHDWTVFEPPEAKTIRHVRTYNATSCSVTLLVPEGPVDHAIMCHMDSAPPIPLNVILSWRAAKSPIVECKEKKVTPQYRVIASINRDAEAAKFTMNTCLQGIECEARRLLFVRTTPNVLQNVYAEPHTQIGVDFSSVALPLTGYLGFPNATMLALQWPNPNQPIHIGIGKVATKMRRVRDLRDVLAQHDQRLNTLRLEKNGYVTGWFVSDREIKIKDVDRRILLETTSRDDCNTQIQHLPNGLQLLATPALNDLCGNGYGYPGLYLDILQRMGVIAPMATPQEQLTELADYATTGLVERPLQQAIPDALREWPQQFT
ncbi:MAG TPA: hypothetical protein VEU30_08840, partial [Thermoanaerobaculia bacterium]|nr:hypothetical protein [Thermoanaerobaculia bacterium]